MTCTNQIHVGDYGTVIDITVTECVEGEEVAADISAATTKTLILKDPAAAVTTKVMTFKTDGSDGVLQYTILTGEFDVAGTWSLQVRVILPTGDWYSEIELTEVVASLA